MKQKHHKMPTARRKHKTLIGTITDENVFSKLLPQVALASIGLVLGTSPLDPQRTWLSKDGKIETRKYVSADPAFASSKLLISRDGYELMVRAFRGKELVFRCALRDRNLDGKGRRGKNSPLNPFPVTHEVANALPHPDFRAAELTVYSYDLADTPIDDRLRAFISAPDKFMFPWSRFNPKVFFPLWDAAFASGLAPWQVHQPLRGFAPHFINAACDLLQEIGYHRVEVVPGWYNAAVFFEHRMNFSYLNAEHEAAARMLEARVQELNNRLPQPLNAWQQSWVVALQNVPSAYLQGSYKRFYLGGIHWVNSPTDTDYCARLYRDLNDFQAGDVP